MKNFLAIFGLLLAGCWAVDAAREYPETQEDNQQLFGASLRACEESFEVSNDDAKAILKSGTTQNKDEECFVGCFLEKVGAIEDGEYNLENAVAFREKLGLNVTEAFTGCFKRDVESKDICVIGPPLWACLHAACHHD